MRVREVTGTVELEDGSEVSFRIYPGGWSQWSQTSNMPLRDVLGETRDAVAAMSEALIELNEWSA